MSIHPFLNGNGRWSRLLANIWLRLKGERSTEWPEPELGDASSIRIEYIQAIQAADRLDYQPLIELHRTFAPL